MITSTEPPPWAKPLPKGANDRRQAGVRYERRCQEHFLSRFGDFYVPGPWFIFKEFGQEKQRWCQPDGLLFDVRARRIYLLEFKLAHTSDAWWQLNHLYLPVVAKAFPPDLWDYITIEVCRWFDPDTKTPEKPKMKPDILMAEPGEFAVHIFKP